MAINNQIELQTIYFFFLSSLQFRSIVTSKKKETASSFDLLFSVNYNKKPAKFWPIIEDGTNS
jgi:hypothetical protein